ncbi:hypothetical protein CC78DRAFT_573144 [Lojkania enalia]|uniref:BTB domain-containing protein n=1 Tax=Lojkania enalia TaxID=147567 RepID=A0A9P4NCV2_9PLEO|nr:hypothetical protein CC78DRAFT_573144 [Didymosphaeria enalia]
MDTDSHARDEEVVNSSFPWPPLNRAPETRHMNFFRTTYDLELCDCTSSSAVAVKVGSPEPSTFHLPRGALSRTSDFFRNALKKEWSHAEHRIVSLPEQDPAIFDIYARWLWSGAEIMIEEHDWKAEFTEFLK